MKTRLDFEDWVREQIIFYQPYLGLHLESIRFEKTKKEDADFIMEITCTYPYFDPTIHYAKSGFEQ